MNVRLLQKAKDIMCEFDSVESFTRNHSIMGKEEELKKALEAPGSVGDLYSTPGGAITKRSSESKPVKSSLSLDEDESLDLIDTIIGVKQKKIPLKKAEYLKHFEAQNKKDFGSKSFNLIAKYFKTRSKE
jgi:hypothetical protein